MKFDRWRDLLWKQIHEHECHDDTFDGVLLCKTKLDDHFFKKNVYE